MKKTLLLVTFLMFGLLKASVEAQEAKSLWIAATAGLNTSLIINQNAYGNGEMDYSTTLNFTAGPGIRYFISEKWGINSSVNRARLGQNYRGLQSGGQATRKVKLDYVEFHMLVMRKIENANLPTWIAFGPEIMFLTAARQEYSREEGNMLPKPEFLVEGTTDIKDRIKPIDVALNFSLNRMFDVYKNKRFMLLLTANLAYGLTDINKKTWNTPNMHNEYAGSHNFYMGIRAGVMFRALKKRR
jgi:hypothetical protein